MQQKHCLVCSHTALGTGRGYSCWVSTSASQASKAVSAELLQEDDDLYKVLLGSSTSPVLFGWWPTASKWTADELAERTTRCLPAVRPGYDLVALPALPEVEELYDCWSKQQGLAAWQAIWFAPRLESDLKEAPEAACKEVFEKIPGHIDLASVRFYPMYLVQSIKASAESYGVQVIGDEADHWLGELSSAKSWLHPHINPEKRGPSLRECGIECSGARGPRGYIASSTAELLDAFRTLQAEMPRGTRFVFKPSWASGGDGIIIDVTEEQLRDFIFPAKDGCTAILEELIEGLADLQSPTLYMIGSESCGALADQLLSSGGVVNEGNHWPSLLPETMAQTCLAAARAIQKVWCLKSQWGLDFVIDRHGVPIIVDLNMGRPNGNFAVRLWESSFCQPLFTHSSSWIVPAGLKAKTLYGLLADADLLWQEEALQGVLIYQFLSGQASSFVVASAASWACVEEQLEKFRVIVSRVTESILPRPSQ